MKNVYAIIKPIMRITKNMVIILFSSSSNILVLIGFLSVSELFEFITVYASRIPFLVPLATAERMNSQIRHMYKMIMQIENTPK